MRTASGISAVAAVLVSLLCAACARPGQEAAPAAPQQAPATVRFLHIEGGCWMLETAAGFLEPVALADEFRQEGLRVVIRFSPTASASICQAGTVVHLESIRIVPQQDSEREP